MPEQVKLLLATPGAIQERRLEPNDQAEYIYGVVCVTNELIKLTNVKLTLIFDFTNQNIFIKKPGDSGQGVKKSTLTDPLEIDIGELFPNVPKAVDLTITTSATPPATYSIVTAATYDVEPLVDLSNPAENIGGGVQLFTVVED